jgi:hypothetical protein
MEIDPRAVEFLRQRLQKVGITSETMSKKLEIGASTFRAWIQQGSLPGNKWEAIVEILQTTTDELKNHGVRELRFYQKRPSLPLDEQQKNIMPLLKNIVKSSLKHISIEEIVFLQKTQRELTKSLSTSTIAELVRNRKK